MNVSEGSLDVTIKARLNDHTSMFIRISTYAVTVIMKYVRIVRPFGHHACFIARPIFDYCKSYGRDRSFSLSYLRHFRTK
jgi:hypothetical protein